ncbi:hypothetical protein QJQ45_006898 [Haematococcus lacustris]|nr:hypothetical protein QJQ45_006898 [Haematococcus lacustris]
MLAWLAPGRSHAHGFGKAIFDKVMTHELRMVYSHDTLLAPPPPTLPAIVDLQFPILAKAAVRLLSVHVSAAAAERNWSVWTSIYRNALRNKLSVEQAEKLVYVKANAKYETDMLAPPKDIRINIFE